MSTKTKIIIAIVALAVAFASGRYSVNAPTVKTTEDIAKTDKSEENKNIKTHKVITETKNKDGSDTTVTTIDQTVGDNKTDASTSQEHLKQTVTPPKLNTLNISALGGFDLSKGGLPTPTYGLSVSKEVLGPVTVGGFGLLNGVVGVSIGLNF